MLWFRTRLPRQAISILKDLQNRHLISYEILGNGSLVKYRIVGWHKNNRILEYNAPCQKDTGFFFLSTYIASEIIGTRRPSEMDVLLDLWVNAVYKDEQVQGSESCPVVYMRNGSGSPLISYASLSQRWHMSKASGTSATVPTNASARKQLTPFPLYCGAIHQRTVWIFWISASQKMNRIF